MNELFAEKYFGLYAEDEINKWIEEELQPVLTKKYGADSKVVVVILAQDSKRDWQDPLGSGWLAVGNHDDDERFNDLLTNVVHKLRFVLRTGLNSSEAAIRPDLVEPGDFPYEGAGYYRGYCGGASGLNEESDWWTFRRTVDKFIELRAAAAAPAIAASKNRVTGMKFMEGELPTA